MEKPRRYWNSTIRIKKPKKKKRIIFRDLITDATYKGKFTKAGRPVRLPLPELKTKADEVFSKWIRNRDKQRGCYANEVIEERGKCKSGWNCCHLFSRSCSDIRWDEFNCHGGCFYHNQMHDHTMRPKPYIMTGWFIKNFGAEKYDELRKRSYIVHTSAWIREKCLQVIKQYGNTQD